MSHKMPPVPPANRSPKGAGEPARAANDETKKRGEPPNAAEQGDTANTRINTTNAGFFKGRRTK